MQKDEVLSTKHVSEKNLSKNAHRVAMDTLKKIQNDEGEKIATTSSRFGLIIHAG